MNGHWKAYDFESEIQNDFNSIHFIGIPNYSSPISHSLIISSDFNSSYKSIGMHILPDSCLPCFCPRTLCNTTTVHRHLHWCREWNPCIHHHQSSSPRQFPLQTPDWLWRKLVMCGINLVRQRRVHVCKWVWIVVRVWVRVYGVRARACTQTHTHTRAHKLNHSHPSPLTWLCKRQCICVSLTCWVWWWREWSWRQW